MKNIQNVINTIQYEESLKQIKKIYPKLSKNSRSAKMIKIINQYGPISWPDIQQKAFSELFANNPNKKLYYAYGLDFFKKIQYHFCISQKDPNDKRKKYYTTNSLGSAFCFIYNNLYFKK